MLDRPDPTTFDGFVALADDHLILGHRLSEWCGHAPMLEEDLSLANMALDLIGQARVLYAHAGEIEGAGRTEDDLAYLRDERAFRNYLLVERQNGDFAHTVLRQFYFAAAMAPYWAAAQASSDETLRALAGKARKETAYHLRHSAEWVIRLGDGTEESAVRMADAVDSLHPYTGDLFEQEGPTEVFPERTTLKREWEETVARVFSEAGLTVPDLPYPQIGGRQGLHGEELGHMLAQMQYLPRAHPGARW